MSLIIDTYNLLHAAIPLGGAFTDLSVRRLCQFLIASPSRQKTTLVLDGRPKPDEPSENEFPDLHLVYSGAGVSADTVIAQLVERSGRGNHRRNLTVISNDRQVTAHARRCGTASQSCEAFLQALLTAHNIGRKLGHSALHPHKTQPPHDPAQTDHWLKEFGINPADAHAPPKKPSSQDPNNPDDLNMKDLLGF